jgi:hypothetical protein
MLLDYKLPQNHVAARDGLPDAIRPTLLEETRSTWKNHPRFAGKASFFMNIHRQLIDGADWLAEASGQMLDHPTGELRDRLHSSNVVGNAKRLIGFAHGHHDIEDNGYFPQFAKLYPQLDRALALLDGDHDVLDASLNGVDRALAELNAGALDRDKIAALYNQSSAMKHIMRRHIDDEEEVIIPIFLRHG